MRTEIKNLHEQQKLAVAEYERLVKEQGDIKARLADIDRLMPPLQPTMAAGDSVEALLSYRLAEQEHRVKRQALADMRTETEQRAMVLNHAIQEARLAVNRYAGAAWEALAESLVAEHAAVLKHVGQVCEKAQFPLHRIFRELPDLTPAEIERIEQKEAFPRWL